MRCNSYIPPQPFRLLANARSHIRYTKTHFPLAENVGRVILEEYFRGDIIGSI